MIQKNKKFLSKMLIVLLSCGFLPTGVPIQVKAATNMGLIATPMGASNAIKLTWNNMGNGSNYMVYSKSANESTFQSIPTKTNIKVLNVYPDAGNNLKTWMETNGFGQGKIAVTDVSITDFNNNPSGYLGTPGNWNYDVVMFGTWDSNNGKDLNENSYNVTKAFIDSGRGALFGHDSVSALNLTYFTRFKTYLNMDIGTPVVERTTSIQVSKKGLLTNYPWNIGDIGTNLTIPATHSYGQVPHGDIWMKLNNSIGDAYLFTWNNAAMIQTGDSNGTATPDEQKVIANTLFYLAQLTDQTQIEDHKSQDFAIPNTPIINSVIVNNGKINVNVTATDNGSAYQYYVKSINGSSNDTSETISAVNTSGIQGYSYVVDNNPNTIPGATVNATNSIFSIPLASVDTSKPLYVHVRAIDNANNPSDTVHYMYNYQNPNAAKSIVEDLLSKFTPTNITSANDITGYLKNSGQIQANNTLSFATTPAFSKTNTSYDSAGSITGLINITDGLTTANVPVNLIIPKLQLSETDSINMSNAIAAVEKAERTKLRTDISNAQSLVVQLPICNTKTDLQNRLNAITNYLNAIDSATSAVVKAETTYSQTDISNAQGLVTALVNCPEKIDLQNRLDIINGYFANLANATTAVEKAEGSKNQIDINTAQGLIDKLPNGGNKSELQYRLDAVKNSINALQNATDAVTKAESTKRQDDVIKAQSLVDLLPDGDAKTDFQHRIDILQGYVNNVKDATSAVVKAESSHSILDIEDAQELINIIPDGQEKTDLQGRLDAVKIYQRNLEEATNAVIKAEKSLSQSDISAAQILIYGLPNGIDKSNLQSRLDAVGNQIVAITNATKAVVKAETTQAQSDVTIAKGLVDSLINGTMKSDLQNRLDAIQKNITSITNATSAVSKAETTKNQTDINSAQLLVDALSSGAEKTNLQNRLNSIDGNVNNVSTVVNSVANAEKTKSETDISRAQTLIDRMPDSTTKYSLQVELDKLKAYLKNVQDATALVLNAETTKVQSDLTNAKNSVNLLTDGVDKTNLLNRLDNLQSYVDKVSSATRAVEKAEATKSQEDIDSAKNLVTVLQSGATKTDLQNRISAITGYVANYAKISDAIEKAEKSGLQSDIDVALALMNQYNISNSSIKSRIDVIQKYINDLDLATAAVEKAERTKLQTDKNYAAPLVKAINDNLYAAKKANLSSRLDVVQNYINQLNDSTYGVVKSEITKTEQDATNAQTPIDKLPSATSENNIQDKINVPSTGTTDKDVLQDGLNNTTSYLEALNVATQAVVKAETSLSQADKNYAQNLADKLSIPSSNLQTRLSVVQKQIDAIAGATSMVELAENSKSQTDLNKAKTAVNSLVSCTQKTDLLSRVDVIQKYINDCKDATYLVSKAEISKNSTDIANAQTAVSNLADGTDKANLQGRLDVLKNKNTPTTTTSGLETATTAVEKAEGSYLLTDYNAAQTLVTSLSSSSDKTKLQSRLTNVKKVITQISTATTAVVSAEKYKTQTYISKAQTLVGVIVDCSQKNDLQNRLNTIQVK